MVADCVKRMTADTIANLIKELGKEIIKLGEVFKLLELLYDADRQAFLAKLEAYQRPQEALKTAVPEHFVLNKCFHNACGGRMTSPEDIVKAFETSATEEDW